MLAFEDAVLELVVFGKEDIITTSPEITGGNAGDEDTD